MEDLNLLKLVLVKKKKTNTSLLSKRCLIFLTNALTNAIFLLNCIYYIKNKRLFR